MKHRNRLSGFKDPGSHLTNFETWLDNMLSIHLSTQETKGCDKTVSLLQYQSPYNSVEQVLGSRSLIIKLRISSRLFLLNQLCEVYY